MMIKKLISSIFKILVLMSFGLAQANAQTTTAGILPLAKTQFLDQNGNPLSSGKVYFYSPGTTVSKTTWSDINKTTPNTNPVNLDAGGRAIVWGDGSYRQQVYDRSNNLIWDQTTAISGSSSGGGIGDGLPVGFVSPWSGLVAPANWQFAYGQAISRAIYPDLLAALTISESITCVGGNPTITAISDTTSLNVGAVLESNCVTGSPTIISKTSSTVTLSSNAVVSVTANGIFYPYGNGDGSTTFNAPDYRGVTLVGRCNMGGVDCSNLNATYFSSNASNTPSALNAVGGNQSKTLSAANIPSITSTNASQNISVLLAGSGTAATATPGNSVSSVQVSNLGGGSVWVPTIGTNGWGGQNNSTGANSISVVSTGTTDTAFSLVSPTKTSNYIIKVTPNANIGIAAISQLQGGLPNKLTGTDANGIFGNVNLPTGLTLSTYNLNFVAQACAGNTWLKSIDTNGTFTCTQPAFSNLSGSLACSQTPALTGDVTTSAASCATAVATNIITNAKLAQANAVTIKGNPTNAPANDQDFTIQGLTARGAPDATNDKMLLYDNAAGTLKYVTPGQVASAAAAGVSSLNGLTGALLAAMPISGGRLTPSSGVCNPVADILAATAIYLAPCNGRYIQNYNGSSTSVYDFTGGPTDTVGLTLTLGSNWAANTLFDVFFTLNGGSPVICTVAWSSSGAGTSSRATALAQYNFLTNATLATCRISNAATVSMGANQGTYVGTFSTNASTGQIDLKFGSDAAGGGAAFASIWNAYNQNLGSFVVRDTTGSTWSTTAINTFQALNIAGTGSGLNNSITFVNGLQTNAMEAFLGVSVTPVAGANTGAGIGLNSVTGYWSRCHHGFAGPTGGAGGNWNEVTSSCNGMPPIGFNYLQAIQVSSSNSALFNGAQLGQTEGLVARWFW